MALEAAASAWRCGLVDETILGPDSSWPLFEPARGSSEWRYPTLHEAIGSSYAGLSRIERLALRRLARLEGRFSVGDGVAALAGISARDRDWATVPPGNVIESLVAKSLVDLDADAPSASRLGLLEVVRRFARTAARGHAVGQGASGEPES